MFESFLKLKSVNSVLVRKLQPCTLSAQKNANVLVKTSRSAESSAGENALVGVISSLMCARWVYEWVALMNVSVLEEHAFRPLPKHITERH